MKMERLAPLRENGVNVGQVGVPWPERTLVEEAVDPQGEWYMQNIARVRELSRDQPFYAEDVLSLSYPAPLRMKPGKGGKHSALLLGSFTEQRKQLPRRQRTASHGRCATKHTQVC